MRVARAQRECGQLSDIADIVANKVDQGEASAEPSEDRISPVAEDNNDSISIVLPDQK